MHLLASPLSKTRNWPPPRGASQNRFAKSGGSCLPSPQGAHPDWNVISLFLNILAPCHGGLRLNNLECISDRLQLTTVEKSVQAE